MNKVPNITSLGNGAGVVSRTARAIDLGEVVTGMIRAADQWVRVIQEESTRREEIRAWEATERERVVAQRDVLLRGLQLTHDERRENFQRLFDSLDVAMRNNDATAAASVLGSITELARMSPFKDLGEVRIVADQLKQGDRAWNV